MSKTVQRLKIKYFNAIYIELYRLNFNTLFYLFLWIELVRLHHVILEHFNTQIYCIKIFIFIFHNPKIALQFFFSNRFCRRPYIFSIVKNEWHLWFFIVCLTISPSYMIFPFNILFNNKFNELNPFISSSYLSFYIIFIFTTTYLVVLHLLFFQSSKFFLSYFERLLTFFWFPINIV